MSFRNLSPGDNLPSEFRVVVEIPACSDPVKYEIDKESGLLCVDRFLPVSMRYPLNYGYIPGTLGGDGDPLDVLVLTPFPLVHGAVLWCRSVGALDMEDESGKDEKIIALPTVKAAPAYEHIQDMCDFPAPIKDCLVHFFEHYKDLDKGKWVKVLGWTDKKTTDQLILSSLS